MSKRFELRHLQYFVAVAEELNFRRAAERLYISQPPLSRQIRDLETILGTRLFERSTNNVQLTAAGLVAYKHAKKLLVDAQELALEMSKTSTRTISTIRIAATIAIPIAKRKLLETEWKKTMGIDALEVEYEESKQLLPRVRQKQFDFALVGGPGDFNGLEYEVIQVLPVVAVIANNHPVANKRMLSLSDFAETTLFWFPRSYNPSYFEFCAKIFDKIGYRPNYCYIPPNDLRAFERIRRGEGFALMTKAQLEMKITGLVHRPLKEGKLLGISLLAAWTCESGDEVKAEQAKRFVAASKKALGER